MSTNQTKQLTKMQKSLQPLFQSNDVSFAGVFGFYYL
jgi:hypothetical protein